MSTKKKFLFPLVAGAAALALILVLFAPSPSEALRDTQKIAALPDGAPAVTTDYVWVERVTGSGTLTPRYTNYYLNLSDITGSSVLGSLTATAAELNKTDGIPATAYMAVTEMASFTESAATTYTYTFEIAAGTLVHDICFTSTVLWGGTSASLGVGDDDDADGWFTTVNLKATDLLVGEVVCAADDGAWGGVDGAYLTTAGRRGRVTAAVDSGWYYGAASEIIMVVAAGTPSTTGRSFGWVTYSTPTATASTDT